MDKFKENFLEPFLISPALMSWHPSPNASDLVKKTLNVLIILRDDPFSLKKEDIKEMVEYPDSQIGMKERYFAHILNTSQIFKQLVEELGSKYPDLNLPSPKLAETWGLVHDLSAIYSRHDDKFKQHDKELTWYFQARHLKLKDIAKHVAMHCAYFELLEMIKQGKGFKEVSLYKDWTKTLNDSESPFFFEKIKKDFVLFLQGKDNLPLITLTVSDYLDNGKPSFNLNTFEQDFYTRNEDIENRYYRNKINAGENATALGYALMEKGGKQRIETYFIIIKDLLQKKGDEYRSFPGLWRT